MLGPRALGFVGKHLYIRNEDPFPRGSSQPPFFTVFEVNPDDGMLTYRQWIEPASTRNFVFANGGRHIYAHGASSTDTPGLKVFDRDPSTGLLSRSAVPPYPVEWGITSFALSPNGKFLLTITGYPQAYIYSFQIDPETGALTLAQKTAVPGRPQSAWLVYMSPRGDHLLAVDADFRMLWVMRFDQQTGAFSTASGPYTDVSNPIAIDHTGTMVIAGRRTFDSSEPEWLTSYRLDATTGALTVLQERIWVEPSAILNLEIDANNAILIANLIEEDLITFWIDPVAGTVCRTKAPVVREDFQSFNFVVAPID